MNLPKETVEHDFPQASNEALLNILKSLDPTEFHTAVIAHIQEHGCTYNQRILLTQVYNKILQITY
jgi:hypothetical protein